MTSARRNIMLGTAGHVDHGKTALVKLLTGCDTDRLAEEKRRGLTIELGFAPCRLADQRICGVIDVPGHVDFIRNMVAGAQGVDVVILVIAADDGVMPQTREHLDILDLMGARSGLVALTKIDLLPRDMLNLAVDEVRKFVEGTFLQGAAICPMSNVTGEGFEGFFAALNAAVDGCPPRRATGLFRLWIERVFTMHGFGSVVSGVPSSGSVRVGDRLRVLPGETTARVRGLQVYGEDAEVAGAGECVAVNLADAESSQLGRGKVLTDSDAFEMVSMFEAEMRLLAHVSGPLKDHAEVHLHIGTAEGMARLALLDAGEMRAGESRLVQVRLAEPLPVAAGERFVIRAGLAGMAGGRVTTLGGGRVLGASNKRLRRKRSWTLDSLAARRDAIDNPTAWCAAILKEAGAALGAEQLARLAQRSAESVREALAELEAGGEVMSAGAAFVHKDVVADAAKGLLERLAAFHQANPARAGMEQAELVEHVRSTCQLDRAAVQVAMEHLMQRQELVRRGAVLALPGAGPRLSDADRRLCEQVASRLMESHLEPPLPADLARELASPEDRLAAIIKLLADQGAVIRLDRKVAMHRQAVDAARQVVLDLFRKSGGFETVEFRDALGVSRKYAVPLLDYFDTVRLTARSGSRRTPGVEAKKVL